MGKGGAPTTTNTVQNQNVAYTPTGLPGFQEIFQRAEAAASQPYQPYTGQLVQGLTPTQTSAIGRINNIAGAPQLTDANIQQYMNPYQSDVINATMANINETNQQQQAQTTGQLTQAAGGVGAERIALGQGELARQQALASNQTLAGLNQQNYAQALAAAQQQQGFGLGAAQTQLGAGGLEQQTGQAGLTAAYQQYLQQLAFPYQQAQFLAGIGLPALGAMGGQQFQTGAANQTMTPPGLSWLQGLAGAGALGYGLFQNGNPFGGGSAGTSDATGKASARGGRINYADGGDVIDLGPEDYHAHEDEALAPVLSDRGYIPDAANFKTPDNQIKPMAPMQMPSQGQSGGGSNAISTLGGLASIGATAAKVIPFLAALKDGGRVSGYDDGGAVQQQTLTPNAYPTPAMLGSPIARGALPMQPQMSSPNVFYGKPLPNMLPPSPVTGGQMAGQNMYELARQALQQQQLGQALSQIRSRATSQPEVSISAQEYARGGFADGGDAVYSPYDEGDYDSFAPRKALPSPSNNLNGPFDWRFPIDMPPAQANPYDTAAGAVNRRFPTDMPAAAYPNANAEVDRRSMAPGDIMLQQPQGNQLRTALDALPGRYRAENAGPTPVQTVSVRKPDEAPTDISGDRTYPRSAPGVFDPAAASPRDILDLNNYRSQVAQRPTVRGLMNNPDFWMRAGLNILAANPAHGPISAIASGAGATVGEYDKWSKDDLTSKQKAQELAGKLMEHANKYTRLTRAERERINIEHERLEQGHYQAVNYTDDKGKLNVGRFNTKTGEITDSSGAPVNPSRIFGRSSKVDSGEITPQQMSIIIGRYRQNHPSSIGLPDDEVRDLALKEINASRPQQAQPGTATNPLPDPGEGKRIKGQFYKLQDGSVRPWQGE